MQHRAGGPVGGAVLHCAERRVRAADDHRVRSELDRVAAEQRRAGAAAQQVLELARQPAGSGLLRIGQGPAPEQGVAIVLLNVGAQPMKEAFPSHSYWKATGSARKSVWVVEPESYIGKADHALTDVVGDAMFEGTGWKQLRGANWFRELLASEAPPEFEPFKGLCG